MGGYLIEVKNCASTTAMKSWWQQAVTAATKRMTRFRASPQEIPRKGLALPGADSTGVGERHQWGRELAYTMDLAPDGFFLLVRERGNYDERER